MKSIFQKIYLVAITIVISSSFGVSQNDLKDFSWELFPEYESTLDTAKDADATIFFEKMGVQFKSEENKTKEYYLFATAIYINNDNGIERNNKIYLPSNYDGRFVLSKARVTNSKGNVINLSDDDIKEAKDEETNISRRYFACEGLDIGSVIEYFFVSERPVKLTGKRFNVPSADKINNFEFTLTCDSHLGFAFKSYNGAPDFVLDTTTSDEISTWRLNVKDVPAFKSEDQARNAASKMSFMYKLDNNAWNGTSNIFSYSEITQLIYANSYIANDKSTKKAKGKFLKGMDIDLNESTEVRTRAVENYIKNNFSYSNYGRGDLSDLNYIMDKKTADLYGYIRLFTTGLDAANVKHQIVLTTNRFIMEFDEDFECYNFLDKFLIYIPELDKYLSPHDAGYRLGVIPARFTYNKGLFLEKISIGNTHSAYSEVKYIDGSESDNNISDLNIQVVLDDDIYSSLVNIEVTNSGYYGNDFRYAYSQLSDEDRLKMIDSRLGYYCEDEITNSSIENGEIDLVGLKPLILKGSYSAESFIESTGDNYIFKVGELIGEQSEMYNEVSERKQELDANYARQFNRKIVIEIPEGYKVSKTDNIKINEEFFDKDGKSSMAFKSDYKFEGNNLVITIDEYYNNAIYSAELFNEYKTVVNAAADFNKVVIYIDKK